MAQYACYLVTSLYMEKEAIVTCALKVQVARIGQETIDDPMSPEGKLKIQSLLPLHISVLGPVVDVQPIYEVHVHEPIIQLVSH